MLIACEFSGIVRTAFAALGHDATSCDLLPTERPGQHIQGDVLDVLGDGWDLMVAHPPCTYLTNSGVCHLHATDSGGSILKGPKRWVAMFEAARLFRAMWNAPIERVAIENPIPHRYARDLIGDYTQIVHPWQHGHGETKATCLWLRGLPPLMCSNIVQGREQTRHRLSPSANRWKLRSVTYQGIADAMANQWGNSTSSQEAA